MWGLRGNEYPSVAMLRMSDEAQFGLSWLALVGIVTSCCGVIVCPRITATWWVISACLFLSFVLDQHRLQPWAYQAAIFGVVFANMPWGNARRWMMGLVASIYIYSAIGKFDFQFAHTVGQDFLAPVLDLAGIDAKLSERAKVLLTLLMPTIELLAGCGVCLPWTRRLSGCMLMLMHGGLVLLLGPWGLNHSFGVLLWNLVLGVTAWELFVRRHTTHESEPMIDRIHVGVWVAKGLVIMAILMPLGERSGYWDHWTSWALYSPHNSRVKVQVHTSIADALPPSLGIPFSEVRDWIDVDLDEWSLRSRGVPIYPQARYQLALATKLAENEGAGNGVRVIVQSVSDRWSGTRREQYAMGVQEMRKLLDSYSLAAGSRYSNAGSLNKSWKIR